VRTRGCIRAVGAILPPVGSYDASIVPKLRNSLFACCLELLRIHFEWGLVNNRWHTRLHHRRSHVSGECLWRRPNRNGWSRRIGWRKLDPWH